MGMYYSVALDGLVDGNNFSISATDCFMVSALSFENDKLDKPTLVGIISVDRLCFWQDRCLNLDRCFIDCLEDNFYCDDETLLGVVQCYLNVTDKSMLVEMFESLPSILSDCVCNKFDRSHKYCFYFVLDYNYDLVKEILSVLEWYSDTVYLDEVKCLVINNM